MDRPSSCNPSHGLLGPGPQGGEGALGTDDPRMDLQEDRGGEAGKLRGADPLRQRLRPRLWACRAVPLAYRREG